MTIKVKVTALGLFLGLGSLASVGLLAIDQSQKALLAEQKGALKALAVARKHHIESYFNTIRGQMLNFAQNDMVIAATVKFSDAFQKVPKQLKKDAKPGSSEYQAVEGFYNSEFKPRLVEASQTPRSLSEYIPGSEAGRLLQAMYIANNPNAVGSKHQLDASREPCDYNKLHNHYHPQIRRYLETFGYYDIFLFDLEGNMIYSVFKEVDYATNFLTGPYKDTNFGDVYRQALKSTQPGELTLEDYRPYEPSYGAAASFIGSPVFYKGKKVGVAIFQMPVGEIQEIMSDSAGMGESGETYLVGADLLMRSNSRFSEESTIFVQRVDTETVRAAIAGEQGYRIVDDYRGIPVVSAFMPVEIEGLDWVVMAEKDLAEVLIPANTLRNELLIIAVALAVVVAAVAVVFSNALTKPLWAVIHKVSKMAEGGANLRERLDESSADELGELARKFNAYTKTLNTFMIDIAEQSQTVAAAATEIAANSDEMSQGMIKQVNQVKEITCAVEEMAASIVEVAQKSGDAARSASDSGRIAREGKEVVIQTVDDMNSISEVVSQAAVGVTELGKRSEQIGQIIEVINDIADQTNLLALNAAIEAARAGEHGRGFAVVADEVRKLADRTTKATDEISTSIQQIQHETGQAVQRMNTGTEQVKHGVQRATGAGEQLGQIVSSATEVAKMIEVIASAAEEQSAASEQVARNIETVRTVTAQAKEGAGQANQAAESLSVSAANLHKIVAQFDLERRKSDRGAPAGMQDRRAARRAA